MTPLFYSLIGFWDSRGKTTTQRLQVGSPPLAKTTKSTWVSAGQRVRAAGNPNEDRYPEALTGPRCANVSGFQPPRQRRGPGLRGPGVRTLLPLRGAPTPGEGAPVPAPRWPARGPAQAPRGRHSQQRHRSHTSPRQFHRSPSTIRVRLVRMIRPSAPSRLSANEEAYQINQIEIAFAEGPPETAEADRWRRTSDRQ